MAFSAAYKERAYAAAGIAGLHKTA